MMKTNLKEELEILLSEKVEDARKREAQAFDQKTRAGSDQLVLFGAGNLGRRAAAGLRTHSIAPLCFVDNNQNLWGQKVEGLPVLSPQEGARLYGDSATFVVTIWRGEGHERMPDRMAQLRALGCNRVVPFLLLFWKYPDLFLPHYTCDLPHRLLLQADGVRRGLHLMADDASRAEYIAQVRFRLLGDFDSMAMPVDGDIYFRDELFRLTENESLVDCGAFDGDTVAQFIMKTGGEFGGISAFEPDPQNYRKLQEQVNRLPADQRQRILLHKAATADTRQVVRMNVGEGASSHLGSGECEVQCVTLDATLGDAHASLIKMDIEGSEMAALRGARKTIAQEAPILAICVYHRQDDLWNVPLLIDNIAPGYSFYLRPHLLEGWDLVCYAVPKGRNIGGARK